MNETLSFSQRPEGSPNHRAEQYESHSLAPNAPKLVPSVIEIRPARGAITQEARDSARVVR